jgi:type VI secretion system protein ImpG
VPSTDPDVDRVLEGVAFLCGRIRQKLDDELPELTASLLSLLWPHYLRTIPSLSILEFAPELDSLQAPLNIPAGSQIASVPVDGTRCRYRTCWPVVLRPWVLSDVTFDVLPGAPARLNLRIDAARKFSLEKLPPGAVRIHLTGDLRSSFTLYQLLSAHVASIRVSGPPTATGQPGPEFRLGPEDIVPVGLSRSEGVLPYPTHSFPGYRLMQEFFAFREKFLFVDVRNLDAAARDLKLAGQMQITVEFDRRPENLPRISRESVRLHCVPIINLFQQPADPVRVRHDRTEYLIQPSKASAADRRHMEVYSVDQVYGMTRAGEVRSREYLPFYSFEHMGAKAGLEQRPYYQTRLVPNVLGGDARFGTDTYIAFVSAASTSHLADEETISIELTCTNRNLPEALQAGHISEPTDSSPSNTRFRNITKPTPNVCPPLRNGLHWRLISHLSLNYVSLMDAVRFRELLNLYDFYAGQDAHRSAVHARMLEGIVSLKSVPMEAIVRGAPLRGTQVELTLNEDHFAGEGEAYLFGRVLDRFLGLYATLNSFTRLTLKLSRTGMVYHFPPRLGEQIVPAEGESTDQGVRLVL